jgi:hypothetical protein
MSPLNLHYYNFSVGRCLKMAIGGGWAGCSPRLMPDKIH